MTKNKTSVTFLKAKKTKETKTWVADKETSRNPRTANKMNKMKTTVKMEKERKRMKTTSQASDKKSLRKRMIMMMILQNSSQRNRSHPAFLQSKQVNEKHPKRPGKPAQSQ